MTCLCGHEQTRHAETTDGRRACIALVGKGFYAASRQAKKCTNEVICGCLDYAACDEEAAA